MVWLLRRRFGFFTSGRKFLRKNLYNHRENCGTSIQLRITIAQHDVRIRQLLGETGYVLHSVDQTFMFPVSADSLFQLFELDLC
jgi:hypothetical protein